MRTSSRRLPLVLLAAATLAVALRAAPRAAAEDPAWPPGESTRTIEGLETVVIVPRDLAQERGAALVFLLHGAGGTASGMARSLGAWAQDGYVVAAPQARGRMWEAADLQSARRIVLHLRQALPVDAQHVHVVGFSNGGWNLTPLAFDDEIRPRSATWIAAGFQGGKVPAWAKDGLGVMAMAGGEDGNLGAARATVTQLLGKVRSVEVQVQEGLGHAFPGELVPYLHWWMNVQDGRFVPGDDRAFPWTDDLDAAIASLAGAKKGGVMVWAWQDGATDDPNARALQHEVFFDPEVRFLGRQLKCVRLEAAKDADRIASIGIKAFPAIAVLGRDGKPKKVHEGKIKANALAKTLRQVAPERKPPEEGR